ncbi:MAG: carotenoid oxygenase family protein [Acidimicrobiia bacterium]|nr:carotenoid oxygenase family protein [Acidimicrobiia bacterium]
MPIPRSILDRSGIPDLDLELTSGTWPADLGGEILISTADQATAPLHAFFGDGALARLSLTPGAHGAEPDRWAWRSSLLDTPSRRLREKRPEVFEATVLGARSPFGWSNAANTAPLPWGDRLFATWDAGRPVEVDPVSLRYLGDVGHRDDWASAFEAPVLPLIPSTAHPVIDPDRDCMWSVALNPVEGALTLVRYDGAGRHVQTWPLPGAPVHQSMHTITQTRDWLILAECAFRADPGEIFGTAERTVTNFPDEPVYLIRKDAVEGTPAGEAVPVTGFRVGPEVMHYYAVYDDSDGITVLFEHTTTTDLAMYLREGDTDAWGRPVDPGLLGMYNHPMHPAVLSIQRFDPETGEVTERAQVSDPDRWWSTQLSAMDWSTEGMSAPTRHHVVFSGFRPEAVIQRAMDLYGDRVHPLPDEEVPGMLVSLDRQTLKPTAEWSFPLEDYPSSPCFVPRDPLGGDTGNGRSRYAGTAAGGHDGYLVVPVHNDAGFRVEVFDADAADAGPLATLSTRNGATMPFLLHSAWMPRAVPAPADVERLRLGDEVSDEHLASLPEDLASVVREVVAELDASAP